MNLRDLEYFKAVADTGQFRAASEKCFVSQPTLSGQIKKLEEELEHPLFKRNTRKVSLTSFGKEALEIVNDILSRVEDLELLAQAGKDPYQGSLRLGIFPTLGPWLFPQLTENILPEYRKMQFFLLEEQSRTLLESLKNGQIDAAILAMPESHEGFDTIPLFREAFVAAVPEGHSWCRKELVQTEDFRGENLLLLSDGHCFRDQALELCRLHGAGEKEKFRANSLETLRQMVRLGSGITLIPRLAVPEKAEPGIHYIPVADEGFHRDIALLCRRTHPRRILIDEIVEKLRGLCSRLSITALES